ncbi:molybdenum cofactor synthesis domain containing protein [Nitzschia inconspicua]|uniref:molybdopterin adenylyltransferase n=1 Tax=Nitzschia inconspicua TaxID=303405 RepID=A0A9K3KU64_9STRA|nr:molybdenum cofactor synthesis domain containing protein [Nitzschia inconspicua]
MGQDSSTHPMVPVPEAIRMVMEETVRLLWNDQKPNPTTTLSSSSFSWSMLLNSVLAEDVMMKEPGYPDYNASIMDGYAIRVVGRSDGNNNDQDTEFTADQAETAAKQSSWTHRIVNKVYAGDGESTKRLEQGRQDDEQQSSSLPTAVYITTGAMVPDTYNCVVPIEECHVSEDSKHLRIAPSADLKPQTWIRPMGCDIPPGSVVLAKGQTIDPVAIGLILQSGVETVTVKRRTRVGVLSTGNELLLDPSLPKSETKGKIPDVNRPILLSLLSTYGSCCEPVDLGTVRDDNVDAMTKTVLHALENCDVVITTGGVSMGETDIVQHVLVDKCGGTLHFGRMNMKPGKPTTFVTVPVTDGFKKLVFALPGNPVSATVCTQLLVKPCIDLYFQGIPDSQGRIKIAKDETQTMQEIVQETCVHPEIMAKIAHDIVLDKKRYEYHRVQIESMEDGTYQVVSTGVQRSSRLMSLRNAEGLLVLPPAQGDKTKALKGEQYLVLLLNNTLGKSPMRIRDSVHFKKKARQMQVAVVEVLPTGFKQASKLEETCSKIEDALSGSNSGNARVVSRATFEESIDKLYPFIVQSRRDAVDFIVVYCFTSEGQFQYNLSVANTLNKHLTKCATSLALQARQGGASEDPKAALFEVVVGYVPEGDGSMLICLPDTGVQGALSNVRGLLKHGLNLARGKVHNHHHK